MTMPDEELGYMMLETVAATGGMNDNTGRFRNIVPVLGIAQQRYKWK